MARKTFEIPVGHPIPVRARIVGARREPGAPAMKFVVAADDWPTAKELIKDTAARSLS
jgi:hypothetical protein